MILFLDYLHLISNSCWEKNKLMKKCGENIKDEVFLTHWRWPREEHQRQSVWVKDATVRSTGRARKICTRRKQVGTSTERGERLTNLHWDLTESDFIFWCRKIVWAVDDTWSQSTARSTGLRILSTPSWFQSVFWCKFRIRFGFLQFALSSGYIRSVYALLLVLILNRLVESVVGSYGVCLWEFYG